MDFILGCNYWASNAGADMWRFFEPDVIENDLKILSSHGIEYLRVFPNWRDFQPVMPLYRAKGELNGYCAENDKIPDNRYFLDENALEKFSVFLKICEKYGIKLIVGLITGWMSGRLYIPTALYGKNLITDPVALYFEELFIKGFVSRFKTSETIYAWDLGNECNCMSEADREQSAHWCACISNAIKAADNSRPVISGMHSLAIENTKPWNVQDHSEFLDILTTHPYPYWGEHTRTDKYLSFKTSMYPTAQNKFYSEIGNRPCLAEELGTMGDMLCNDKNSADFLRINMFSLWANNASGVMWWCNSDQTALTAFPYSETMVELELGMMDIDKNPKPVLKEVKAFREFLSDFKTKLPAAETDAVCILSKGQDQWGIAYMTHLLLRRCNLNCRFAYAENELPNSNLYILPSLSSDRPFKNSFYKQLKEKVFNGADILITLDDGVLCEFEDFAGIGVSDYCEHPSHNKAVYKNEEFNFNRARTYFTEPITAKVLAEDNDKNPFITVNSYGKGKVFTINAPLEKNLLTNYNFENSDYYKIYNGLLSEYVNSKPIKNLPCGLVATYHKTENSLIAVIINHSSKTQSVSVEYEKIYYGNPQKIKPWDATVVELKIKKP